MSIMNQYTPLESVLKYPEINRKVTESEYDEVLDFAVEIGVENAFVQEGVLFRKVLFLYLTVKE